MKVLWVAALLVLGGAAEAQSPSAGRCFGTGEVTSPDGALSARITRSGRSTCGESRVEIFLADGHLLSVADYTSSDGQGGEGVIQLAWSPDSQYLVYSLSQPANRPSGRYTLAIYARKHNKVKTLAAARPEFSFTAEALEMTGGDGQTVRLPLAAQ
jgi:hypothetical protein